MKPSTFVALVATLLWPQPAASESPASFACILQADSFAESKSAAVGQLAACKRDWIVLDAAFDGGTPWERPELEAIRNGRAGRRVLAYVSIGEAEDYRAYWHKEWASQGNLTGAAPAWLGGENPDWKGNYRVKYWHAEWQGLVLAAIDDAMVRGFDGVYLDIVDGFETFERDGNESIDNRLNRETKQSYRRDMVDWVKAIAARARANKPAALVVPQNGSQLIAHPDFLEVISAVGIEDLFTRGDTVQPKPHADEVLRHLEGLAEAGKPALLIEYPRAPDLQAFSQRLAAANGLVWLVTDRHLKTLGESGR